MPYECELEERASRPVLSIRARTPVQNLPQVLGPAWGTIMQFLGELGEQPAGPPYVAYYNMDMQDLDIEIGFPVSTSVTGRGDIQASETPAGSYATCLHKGPYPEVGQAYDALWQWTNDNGREATGIAYETYLNDPRETPPEELLTRVALLLRPA
jgi:effector-binding domain-containing protein